MNKIVSITIVILLVVCAFGCGKSNMAQTKMKNKAGLPMMVPQVDPNQEGALVIKIEGNLIYPGSTQRSTYEYTTKDSQEAVAKWFEANLQGATAEKQQLKDSEMWTVNWNDIIIRTYPYETGGTLIRYKKKLNVEGIDSGKEKKEAPAAEPKGIGD